VQFDEATALLVGDSLQSLAFQLVAERTIAHSAALQLEMVRMLALAAGSRGMAGGQAIDLDSVGKSLTQTELEFMHMHKTGALIRAAVLLGAHCGDGVEAEYLDAINHYAKCVGLAFQVVDDILDVEASTATLGKTAGKDAENNKPTYVSILGLSDARNLAQELHQNALSALTGFGDKARRLVQLADFIVRRQS
jgi:farnesyl diphosphate synthase